MTNSATESELELIQSTIRTANPHSILQIGTGNFQCSKAIIETIKDLPSAQLTLLISKNDAETIEKLKEQDLDQWVDIIELPADQILPDFYFQKHAFDFAIINPTYGEQETRVSFYYINKLLGKNNKLIVNEAPTNGLRALCRDILSTNDFEVDATSEAAKPMPKLERLARDQYQRLPQWIKGQAEQLVNPTLLETDPMLGLFGNTVVFNKVIEVAEKAQEEEIDVDAMIEAMI